MANATPVGTAPSRVLLFDAMGRVGLLISHLLLAQPELFARHRDGLHTLGSAARGAGKEI